MDIEKLRQNAFEIAKIETLETLRQKDWETAVKERVARIFFAKEGGAAALRARATMGVASASACGARHLPRAVAALVLFLSIPHKCFVRFETNELNMLSTHKDIHFSWLIV